MTYQIGRFYLGTSETSSQRPKEVHLKKVRFVITSKCGPRRLNLNEVKMRRRCNIACRLVHFIAYNPPRHNNPIDTRLTDLNIILYRAFSLNIYEYLICYQH